MNVSALGNVTSSDGGYTLFAIDSPAQAPRFMRFDHRRMAPVGRTVVVLDADRCRRLWRHIKGHSGAAHSKSSSHDELSQRFDQGASAPLSLPIVSVKKPKAVPPMRKLLLWLLAVIQGAPAFESAQIEILQGRRRIEWLIAHGYRRIPVECLETDASKLVNLAGIAGNGPYSAASLQRLPVVAEKQPV